MEAKSNPAAKKMSLLETLPIEILESIFLACLDISMPLASHTLHTKFSSPHLKHQFQVSSKKTKYMVIPTNASCLMAHESIETALHKVTKADDISSYQLLSGEFLWVANLSVLQREEVEKIDRVEEVHENVQESL